ncbi:NUDIX hydrolase [Streptomyces sp. NPDC059118]|uniref:NUDIX hydrolase n=1 Tax=unclassified Streptomyces TaxID=2593676 RepID=UPI00367865B2
MPRTDSAQLLETRCSVAVFRGDRVLLVRSVENGSAVWKLPGGHVRTDEGLLACARRELHEETGLRLSALHCAFVLDIHDRTAGRYMVEIILIPDEEVDGEPSLREPGRQPEFVRMDDLARLRLSPPIESVLHGLRSLHRQQISEGASTSSGLYATGIGEIQLDRTATATSVAIEGE